jgi:hypothetical protein
MLTTSGRRDSNPQPTAWKAVTLPLSYSRTGNYTVLLSKVNMKITRFCIVDSEREFNKIRMQVPRLHIKMALALQGL